MASTIGKLIANLSPGAGGIIVEKLHRESHEMDITSSSAGFGKTGQNMADTAALKIQGGIRQAKRTVDDAGDQLSSKIEGLRGDAKPLIKKATKEAQSFMQTLVDGTQQIRDNANQASVIAYTNENPVKAILIAAASGTVLAMLFHAISRSRD